MTRAGGRRTRDLVEIAAAVVGAAAAAQAVKKACCEFHAEVEDVQCCHDCPDDPENQAAPQRHDGDCQMAQHTYVHQGEPGVFSHGPTQHYAADVVGTNGRRLLIRDDADGVYVGGVLLTNDLVFDMLNELRAMVINRLSRGAQ